MAKNNSKEEVKTSSTDDIFSKLLQQHNKIVPNSAVIGDELESEIKMRIDSGSLLLNMILSNDPKGGWPCGRIVHVFGKESIGKSTLAYCAIASCQREGGIAIYADLEHSANKKFMRMLGVDLSKMIWTDIDNVEELFTALEDNLTVIANSKEYKNKPVIIILDSNAALMTKAEEETGYEMNMNTSMLKSKQMHKALRKINGILNKANACLFVIDQIKDNVTGYGPSYVISGSKALAFYSSIRLYLEGKEKIKAKDPTVENEYQEAVATWKAAGGKKSGLEKPVRSNVDEVVIGYEVKVYTTKNKTAPPDRTAHFRIMFAEGLRDEECYLDYLIKYGAVKQNGAYCTITEWSNDIGSFYKTQWLDVLSDKEVYDKVVDFIVKKMTIEMNSPERNYTIVSEEINDDNTNNILKGLKKQEE